MAPEQLEQSVMGAGITIGEWRWLAAAVWSGWVTTGSGRLRSRYAC